jgi:GntR family transcriptional regulator
MHPTIDKSLGSRCAEPNNHHWKHPCWLRAASALQRRIDNLHGRKALFTERPSRRALYLQVRDVLAERIARREWRPGFAVPNEGDLARELGVSTGTVRKALNLMESDRLITRRQGKGTFVNDQTSDVAAARFNNLRGPTGERIMGAAESTEITEGVAGEHECARLRLRAGAAVYRIRRHRRVGGRSFLVEEVTLPAALFSGLREKGTIADDISILAQEYGILLGKAEERVSVDVPPPTVAATLGVALGTRVMALDRVVCMLDGPPVEWRVAHCQLAGSYYQAEMS